MLSALISVSNVEISLHHLIHEESLNFHLDEDFENHINLKTICLTNTDEENILTKCIIDRSVSFS